MSKHNIRTDSYFKKQIMNKGKNISSACKTLISEIPNEIIDKLSKTPFDKVKKYIDYIYADFNSTQDSSTSTGLSVRLSYDLEIIINKCSIKWGASKSEVIRILLAIGIMYQNDKEHTLENFNISSLKNSFPKVCYQHGNKNNPNIKAEITKILKQIPNDVQTVVEPFMGMCGLTLNVLETLSGKILDYDVNDKDNNIFNLYNCICNNTNKLLLACERLVNRLKAKTDTFKIVKDRHPNLKINHNHKYDYDAAADYMYLDAVSVRHDKKTLQKQKSGNYLNIDEQIELFCKYILNIKEMHNYLIKTKISNKHALEMLKNLKNLKELKNIMKILYLLDPPYISSLGYSSKTNGVDDFTYDNYKKLVSFCKNISSDSIFLLFCRFSATRSQKKGETFEDVKIKEQDGYFEADDRTLRGFYKRVFGVETKGSKHKFFYKEVSFDSKGTMEVIISNYQFDGFKPL